MVFAIAAHQNVLKHTPPPVQLQSTIFCNLRNLKNLLQELEVSAAQSKSQSALANATNGRHTLGLICSVLSSENYYNATI